MPNRSVHVVTSGTLGTLYALHMSRAEPEAHRLLEVIGGGFGGYTGGRLPDVLEPATTPNQRGRAHSCVTARTLLKLSATKLERWQVTCREWAEHFDLKRSVVRGGSLDSLLLQVAAMVCRLLAGFLAGLLAGYVVHLALDACTPCCISLV